MTAAAIPAADADALDARRARLLRAARARTRLVAGLRAALLALFGLVVLNAVVQIVANGEPAGAPPPAASPDTGQRIVNPRFTGRDEAGAPFVVTADAALRRRGEAGELIDLERPRLDYDLLADASASGSSVLAADGVYDAGAQTLRLESDVRLSTPSGYAFSTPAATLHLADGRIEGGLPVAGEAPFGLIRAGGFEVRDRGDHIIFRDGVRTLLYVGRADARPAEPPAGDADGGAETEDTP